MGLAELPPDLGAMLKDFDRRLRALETAPSLAFSSIKDGALQILDNSSPPVPVVTLGKLGANQYGIKIQNSNQRVISQIDTLNGSVAPKQLLVMTPSPTAGGWQMTGTAAGNLVPAAMAQSTAAFLEMYRCDFYSTGGTIAYDGYTSINFPSTATAVSWQIKIAEVGGAMQVVASGTLGTGINNFTGQFAIPASCLVSGTDPRGRNMSIRLEVKSGTAGQDVSLGCTYPWSCFN